MGIIVPAILPASLADLTDKLTQLRGLSDEVQIDIVDGKYAAPPTWPYAGTPSDPSRMLADGEMLPGAGEFRIEVDLMSADPETVAGSWIGLGASRLTIHAESTRFLPRLLENLGTVYGHEKGFASELLTLGFAIGAETDIALIEPFLDRIEYVQFMGIRSIGKQGQPFEQSIIPKIRTFRKRYPDMVVQVDGGVSLQTAPQLLEAGVSRLVVGSALWKSGDVAATLRAFTDLTERHGIYG